MRNIILTLLLTPFLLFSQSTIEYAPDFTVTDTDGQEHNLYSYLDQGTTVVIQFHSVALTCTSSYNSTMNLIDVYNDYGQCNNIFVIQIAWNGGEQSLQEYVNNYGDPDFPMVSGGPGSEIFELYEGFWATECWLIRPDRSLIYDIVNWVEGILPETLETEGFVKCEEHVVSIQEYGTEDKTIPGIYDSNGRLVTNVYEESNPLKNLPAGMYIINGEKFVKVR